MTSPPVNSQAFPESFEITQARTSVENIGVSRSQWTAFHPARLHNQTARRCNCQTLLPAKCDLKLVLCLQGSCLSSSTVLCYLDFYRTRNGTLPLRSRCIVVTVRLCARPLCDRLLGPGPRLRTSSLVTSGSYRWRGRTATTLCAFVPYFSWKI
jgi:hypothetical protein